MQAIRITARASDYISHIDDLPPGPAVLYLRVSTRAQKRKIRLERLEAHLCRELALRGLLVVAGFKDVISGKQRDRHVLQEAVGCAKTQQAVLVTLAASRFIRHQGWQPNFRVQPTVSDFEKFQLITDGVRLATYHPPEHGDLAQSRT